jgi:hypothetical protein
LVPAVWSGLLSLARELPLPTLAQLSGDAPLKLSALGQRLVARLEPRGSSALARCLNGCAREPIAEALSSAHAPFREARAQRAVLRTLGAAVEADFEGEACRLLLRKQRQIRRRASAHALLDLPAHARAEQVRPALRRLASKLHPDRFHANEAGLREASHEVMRALSRAHGELLASQPRSR